VCDGGCRSGTNLDREGVRAGPPSGLAPTFGESNAGKDHVATAEANEIKDRPRTGPCGIDNPDSQAKPGQYGRRIYGLGRGLAWIAGNQTFLTVEPM
jgi:hypothetical protein